jgi:hypothetical protein
MRPPTRRLLLQGEAQVLLMQSFRLEPEFKVALEEKAGKLLIESPSARARRGQEVVGSRE